MCFGFLLLQCATGLIQLLWRGLMPSPSNSSLTLPSRKQAYSQPQCQSRSDVNPSNLVAPTTNVSNFIRTDDLKFHSFDSMLCHTTDLRLGSMASGLLPLTSMKGAIRLDAFLEVKWLMRTDTIFNY